MGGRREVPAFFQFGGSRAAQPFNAPDSKSGKGGGLFAHAQIFRFVNLVVKAVEKKVDQVGNYRFRTFRLQQFHKMVVAGRGKFYKNFAYDAYAGFPFVRNFYLIKISYDLSAHFIKFKET